MTTRAQQQALMGAWYNIIGRQPAWGHGYGPYGSPHYLMGADPAALPPPMAMPPMPPPMALHPHHAAAGASAGAGEHHHQNRARNALIEAPGPEHAGREVLPMSTGVAILPTQSAQITARPQRVAFRPERVFISAAGTSGGAADWVVNDIKIGNRSQFSQSGDVPGDMFATNAIDGFVSFETAQTAMDVVMVVTYIGLNESGVPFFASIVGTAAI
jgi:hypothetical protein